MGFFRNELSILKSKGFLFENPYEVVEEFERQVANFSGAPYAVAVDCATHAMELSMRYLIHMDKIPQAIKVPTRTYPSVPMMLLKLGLNITWSEKPWSGIYRLEPTVVIDGSLRFLENMYEKQSFHCLSFQHKKRIPIGRGGVILTDNENAYLWLKKACHDGRTPGAFWHNDNIEMIGYHYYMTPDDAARGLLLLENFIQKPDESDLGDSNSYPDLRNMKVFNKQRR